jgi:outer membrane protein TolC
MKTKSFIKVILSIWLCSYGLHTKAQQGSSDSVHRLTAREAVDYAMKNAVAVKNALLDIQMQEAQNKEVIAQALPQISGNGSVTYNPNVGVQTFPNFIAAGTYGVLAQEGVKNGAGEAIVAPSDYGTIQAQFGVPWMLNAGIDLNQILFDGQVFVGLKARSAAIKNAELAADVTKEQIKSNVYKIYFQLTVGKRQIGSLDANIANYEKLLHDTKIIYQNGFAEKLDVSKVQVQLSNLQTQKLKTQNQLDAGMAGLKFLMNMPQKDVLILTDTLSDEKLKANLLDESYDYADRKQYQLLENTLQLREFNIERYKLSKLPSLTFAANYSTTAQRQKFDFTTAEYFPSSFLAFRLKVPIYAGGYNNAKVQEAKISFQQTQNTLEQLKASIDNDVTESRISMKSALSTLDNQSKNIELAQEVYDAAKLKYDQGLGSNQEISTAQADLVTAQNNYYSSLYDAVNARIDFLTAIGKLQ